MTEDTALASGKGAVVGLIAVFMMGIDLVIQIQDGGGDCARLRVTFWVVHKN